LDTKLKTIIEIAKGAQNGLCELPDDWFITNFYDSSAVSLKMFDALGGEEIYAFVNKKANKSRINSMDHTKGFSFETQSKMYRRLTLSLDYEMPEEWKSCLDVLEVSIPDTAEEYDEYEWRTVEKEYNKIPELNNLVNQLNTILENLDFSCDRQFPMRKQSVMPGHSHRMRPESPSPSRQECEYIF
jgi:hypothetical protein